MELEKREKNTQIKNIGVTLSESIIDELDRIGMEKDYSRSALIRYAIEKTFKISDNIISGKFKARK